MTLLYSILWLMQLALFNDLGKSSGESYLTEIHFVYSEINIALKGIKKWVKRKSVRSNLINFPSSDYIIPEPVRQHITVSPGQVDGQKFTMYQYIAYYTDITSGVLSKPLD